MTEYGLLGKFEAYASEYSSQYKVARILSQERGIYRIISIDGERLGEVSGKLRYNACCASDFPAVGDFVLIDSECEHLFVKRQVGQTKNRLLPQILTPFSFVCRLTTILTFADWSVIFLSHGTAVQHR